MNSANPDPFGLRPEDEYGRHWCKVMALMGDADPAIRDRAHFALAEETRRNLHRVKPVVVPKRPHSVPDDDDEILSSFIDKKRPAKGTERARTHAMFGAWRRAVWLAEQRNQANIIVIATAALTYRRLELDDFLRQVEQFLEDEYDIRDAVPDGIGNLNEWARRRSTRFDVLSWELRHLERRPTVWSDESEDDDDSVWKQGTLPVIPGTDDPPF